MDTRNYQRASMYSSVHQAMAVKTHMSGGRKPVVSNGPTNTPALQGGGQVFLA